LPTVSKTLLKPVSDCGRPRNYCASLTKRPSDAFRGCPVDVRDVLELLDGVRQSGTGWSARCPGHDDRHASLSVSEGTDGAVLLKCHAGCSIDRILAALKLQARDLFPAASEAKGSTIVARYPYRDETGKLLSEVVRYSPKGFRQRRPDGSGGWVWSLQAVRSVLYRLPELLSSPGRQVFIVEGEKDADRLAELGFVSTTNPGGAGKWKAEFCEALRNRHVIIVPDKDEAGRRHARMVARMLHGVAARVKVLTLPDLPDKGDVSDWLSVGGTAEELKRLAGNAAEWKPNLQATDNLAPGPILVCLKDVKPECVSWLWGGRIPFGKLTLIEGDPGLGKSTLLLDLAARVSRGLAMPDFDGHEAAGPFDVIILTAEDGLGDTVRPRLDAAGADLTRVHALRAVRKDDGEEVFPTLSENLEQIERAIIETGAKLVGIDPVVSFIGSETNTWRDQDVRRILGPLAALAERLGVAIVLIRHLTKSNGAPAIYRGGGSIGFVAAVRSALLVARDPEDESRIVLASVKSNLAVKPDSLAYRLESAGDVARVVWDKTPVSLTADDLLRAQGEGDGDRTERDEAADFLRDLLQDGPKPATTIQTEAKRSGHAWRTVRRAKDALNVVVRKSGMTGGWEWSLPPEGGHERPKVSTPRVWPSSGEGGHLRGSDSSTDLLGTVEDEALHPGSATVRRVIP
jgi:putative DNA primase/helicase